MKKTILIFMTLLLVSVVFAQQLSVSVDLPEYSKYHSIDIKGITSKGVQVSVYVNNDLKRRETNLASDNFIFNDVVLDSVENEVLIIVEDSTGLKASSKKKIIVDTKPPVLNVNFPAKSVMENTLKLSGTVDESVTLNYWSVEEGTVLTDDNKQSISVSDSASVSASVSTSVSASVSFTLDLTLPSKNTLIVLSAVDKAGHETKQERIVKVDTSPPKITSNLNQFKYVESNDFFNIMFHPEIKVSGTSDEPVAITVFVNDNAQNVVNTDSNNNFEVDVKLKQDIVKGKLEGSDASAQLLGQSWTNTVKLVAIDEAGRETIEGPVDIVYSHCGKGGPFRIPQETLTPNILNPRLLLQGLQTAGFGFNVEYTGAHKANIKKVRIAIVPFKSTEKDKYDQKWVLPTPYFDKNLKNDGGDGYVNIKFKVADVNGETDLDKEQIIADHNKDSCLINTGFGCVKFYLQFDIEYTETYERTHIEAGVQTSIAEEVTSEVMHQKTCDRYEIAIDQPRSKNLIPKKHLNTMVETLQKTVDAINNIKTPLTTVNEYLTYACVLGSLGTVINNGVEAWNCKWSGTLSKIMGGSWDSNVANAGLCEEFYADNNDRKKRDACLKCENSIKRRNSFDYNINSICDRLVGPAAPTSQKYIDTNKNVKTIVNIPVSSNQKVEKWRQSDGNIYVGNDCAFEEFEQKGLPVVEKIYQEYKSGSGTITPSDCNENPRPANPACCGKKYMNEWGSACGIPGYGIDTFNELKESACLAANAEGKNEVAGEPCYQMWNSVAGFCDPKQVLIPQTIFTSIAYQQNNLPGGASDNSVYVIIIPKGVNPAGLLEGASPRAVEDYKIHLGYVANRHEITRNQNSYYLNAETVLIPQKEITNIFFDNNGLKKESDIDKEGFKKELANVAGQPAKITDNKINEIYSKVRNSVGTVEKSYVVRPDSGLLRSLQCVYLPGVINWLTQWGDIASHAQACLKTIALTGDGNPGTCQEFLSRHVCDFAFDALTCAAQKYTDPSPSGGRIGASTSMGNLFGAISDGSLKTKNSIRERYGATGLWNQLFSEKKIQNSVCAFAFTGTWDLDVGSIAQMSLNSPQLPSQGLISSCRRYWGGYTPGTGKDTKGLTNWIYSFATFLQAGSDVRWWLELKCSDGRRCNPNDGYKGGKCDCEGIGDKIIRVQPDTVSSDQLSKGELMDIPVQIIAKATGTDLSPKYRYDKAILHWESEDSNVPNDLRRGQTECNFSLVGNDAPPFCQFNADKGAFWCQWGQQIDLIKLKQDSSKPKYPHMFNGNGVFGLNDELTFDIVGEQVREDVSLENVKYLLYNISNNHGKTLRDIQLDFNVPENLRLSNDNAFTKTLTVSDAIDKTDFGGRAFYMYPAFNLETRTYFDRSFENLIRQVNVVNAVANKNYDFVFEFDGNTYNVYNYAGESGNGFNKGEKLAYNNPLVLQNNVQQSILITQSETAMLQFVINTGALPPETVNDQFQVRVRYPDPVRTDQECGDNAKLVTWWADFEAHLTDETGVPTEFVARDEDGNPAKISIPFNVICKDGNILEVFRELSVEEQFYQRMTNREFAKLYSGFNNVIYQYTNINVQERGTPREFLSMTREKFENNDWIEKTEITVTKERALIDIQHNFYVKTLSMAEQTAQQTRTAITSQPPAQQPTQTTQVPTVQQAPPVTPKIVHTIDTYNYPNTNMLADISGEDFYTELNAGRVEFFFTIEDLIITMYKVKSKQADTFVLEKARPKPSGSNDWEVFEEINLTKQQIIDGFNKASSEQGSYFASLY